MSMTPSGAAAASAIASTSASTEASHLTASPPISLASSWTLSNRRAPTTTRAPRWLASVAVAQPLPPRCEAPSTTTVLPLRSTFTPYPLASRGRLRNGPKAVRRTYEALPKYVRFPQLSD